MSCCQPYDGKILNICPLDSALVRARSNVTSKEAHHSENGDCEHVI